MNTINQNETNDKYLREGLNEAFSDLRLNVVNATSTMSEITGKHDIIEKHSTPMLRIVDRLQSTIMPTEDTMSADDLYKPLSPYENSSPNKAINLLHKYSKYLNSAVDNYDDEISRENDMILFSRMFYEFDYIQYDNENFMEIVNAIKNGIYYKNNTFTVEDINALKNTVTDLIKNVNITDDLYHKILDRLEARYNISGPLSEVSLLFDGK
ncbi:hypothetical protein [Candidatus Magnetominusculus dajiuhuensis]|uniref:hypothetical protein n=1 Tax=Candidatus Magnetominusculus dajiuhuensis TaxID=3137712 RepID=UPI003B429934